jgi:putative membrane protein insertion efficiency factor
MTARRSPVARVLLRAVGFYSRAVSPALPPRCRFYPTCSAYAAEAVAVHGAGRGTWLALRRILRCAPWHPGGVDLVPPRSGTRDADRSWSTEVPLPLSSPTSTGAARSDRATPPAPNPAPQEESSVA